MLINASHPEENRVAIVVDGILSELDIEIAGQEQTKGNIYKAVVVRVETGLQAAFVDYGAEKLGFLQIGEVHTKLYPPKDETKHRPRIAEILQRGQEILVQIVKEERGNKGAALTTFLSIPGRYMVLMPDSTTKGVSRKISVDSERRSLKKTMAELELPERMGYIVRTAGIGKDKEELKRDFDYLVRLFEGIVARKDEIKAPAQLYQESNLAIRSIRDYFSTEMDEVLVDDHKVFQDTKDFFSLVMPELKHLVKRHRERRPIFSRYQIEEQIDGLAKNQAPLPSGGSIVIDQTEALVAIDVNSGKMSGESGIEATAYKTNLEAAAEVGRQLRLRDLGGLIVIDFIDMRDRKNIREIEQEMRKALKDDKAKVSVGRISQFGLLEMSRQRLKPVLSVGAYLECPHCKGIGQIKSIEAQAVVFLRQAHTAAAKGQIGHIEAKVPLEVANYLLNQKRATISELERQLKLKISLFGSANLLPGELELELHKRVAETENTRQILPVSHDNQIENALAAAQQEEQEGDKKTKEQTEGNADKIEINQETGEEPAEKPKKRRRRRRKKPATNNQEAQEPNQQESGDQLSAEKTQTEPSAAAKSEEGKNIQPIELKSTEESQPASEKPQEEKPKPRPRRRSRKKPAAAAQTTAEENKVAAEQDLVPQKEAEVKSAVTALSTTTDKATPTAEEKPKRRPRRTTKKTTGTATTSPEKTPAGGASTKTIAAETKPATAPEIATEEKPKPRRAPRKTAKKVATETETVSATEVVSEEKPKRRPRRAAKKTPAVSPTETEPAVATEKTTDEKPKRQPRKTTKKLPEIASDNTSEVIDKTPATDTKKPQRRPRKAPVKKTESQTESPTS